MADTKYFSWTMETTTLFQRTKLVNCPKTLRKKNLLFTDALYTDWMGFQRKYKRL